MSKRNKKLAKSYQGQACVVCKTNYGTVGDHIITYASRPDLDRPENIWPLCVAHHAEKGQGLTRFVDKYNLQEVLIRRGFEFNVILNKWYMK